MTSLHRAAGMRDDSQRVRARDATAPLVHSEDERMRRHAISKSMFDEPDDSIADFGATMKGRTGGFESEGSSEGFGLPSLTGEWCAPTAS